MKNIDKGAKIRGKRKSTGETVDCAIIHVKGVTDIIDDLKSVNEPAIGLK